MSWSIQRPIAASTLWTLLLAMTAAAAQSVNVNETRTLPSQPRAAKEVPLEERQAQDWGLKPDEWARYKALMRGPLGIYSPQLDPLTALGVEARSAAERRYYAEMQVHAEGRRTEKLLAYQREYDEAWQRIYPNLQPLRPAAAPRSHETIVPKTSRLIVFVKEDCAACLQRVKELQAAGRAFDLYLVGSRQEDSRIRQWASRAGVDPAKVQARTITLNHDAGRWLAIDGHGALPAVMAEVGGQWQRQ